MTEIKSAKMNYDYVRNAAFNSYKNAVNANYDIIKSMTQYYREGQKSPSIAHMIFRDTFKKSSQQLSKELIGMNYSNKSIKQVIQNVLTNIDGTSSVQPVKDALHNFADAWRTLYPRTKDIRRFIVENDWIKLDKVTRKKGLFAKLKLKAAI